MNIKVKLPFLFTFLQLIGATCFDQYWLCLLSTRVLDPEEVEISIQWLHAARFAQASGNPKITN